MSSWRCFPFVDSTPRAYRLKASNAASSSSTSTGTIPAAPPGDEAVRLARPALLFEKRRDGCGEPLLHVDDGAVLVECQRLDLAPEDFRLFHVASMHLV